MESRVRIPSKVKYPRSDDPKTDLLYKAMTLWASFYHYIAAECKNLDRLMVLSYESFCSNPESEIYWIYKFLERPVPNEVLRRLREGSGEGHWFSSAVYKAPNDFMDRADWSQLADRLNIHSYIAEWGYGS